MRYRAAFDGMLQVFSLVRRENSPVRISGICALVLALAALTITPRAIAAEERSEYALKAAFVFNFLKFTEFPARAEGSLYLCVFSDAGDFESFASLHGRHMYDRSLLVERRQSTAGVSLCDVVFIASSSPVPFRELLAGLESKPVLLVGEEEGFLTAGGVIRFFIENGKIRFRIYPKQAERRGLKLSAKLLALAEIKTD